MNDKLLDQTDVAALVKVAPGTLSNWIYDPSHPFPKGIKMGDGPRAPRRWFESTVLQWLRERDTAA